jgi:hypothetical protein
MPKKIKRGTAKPGQRMPVVVSPGPREKRAPRARFVEPPKLGYDNRQPHWRETQTDADRVYWLTKAIVRRRKRGDRRASQVRGEQ